MAADVSEVKGAMGPHASSPLERRMSGGLSSRFLSPTSPTAQSQQGSAPSAPSNLAARHQSAAANPSQSQPMTRTFLHLLGLRRGSTK